MKWSFVPKGEPADGGPKYLVCNADEMEPGTFKDRYLLERNPHLLIEGMIIGAYAIGAKQGYVFLRGEYHLPYRRLQAAIDEACAKGYLGDNLFGSGFSFTCASTAAPGATSAVRKPALLNALEGKRASPRTSRRSPPPAALGAAHQSSTMWKPSATCRPSPATAPIGIKTSHRGRRRHQAVRRLRPGQQPGPLGIAHRHFDPHNHRRACWRHAGRLPAARPAARRRLHGLPSGAAFRPRHGLRTIQKAGSRMGTGTMILMDDTICPVDMCRNLEHFFAQESCGFCTPCREGLPWVEQLLTDIKEGRGREGIWNCWSATPLSSAASPTPSACMRQGRLSRCPAPLKYFREDFEEHVRTGKCRYRRRRDSP